jgi:hypothetical protein
MKLGHPTGCVKIPANLIESFFFFLVVGLRSRVA